MKYCSSCIHWHKLPPNPGNIADVKGVCNEAPPVPSVVATPKGLITLANYPTLPPNFQACSKHQERQEVAGQ